MQHFGNNRVRIPPPLSGSLIIWLFIFGPTSLVAGSAKTADTQSTYSVVLFSYEDPPLLPLPFKPLKYSSPWRTHTFVTFIKRSPNGIKETVTLSWQAKPSELWGPKGYQRLPMAGVQEGMNWTLEGTLRHASDEKQRVQALGPFSTGPDVFEKAKNRETYLDSGAVLYKMEDDQTRPKALNCIHAVSDLDGFGELESYLNNGSSATQAVLAWYRENAKIGKTPQPEIYKELAALVEKKSGGSVHLPATVPEPAVLPRIGRRVTTTSPGRRSEPVEAYHIGLSLDAMPLTSLERKGLQNYLLGQMIHPVTITPIRTSRAVTNPQDGIPVLSFLNDTARNMSAPISNLLGSVAADVGQDVLDVVPDIYVKSELERNMKLQKKMFQRLTEKREEGRVVDEGTSAEFEPVFSGADAVDQVNSGRLDFALVRGEDLKRTLPERKNHIGEVALLRDQGDISRNYVLLVRKGSGLTENSDIGDPKIRESLRGKRLGLDEKRMADIDQELKRSGMNPETFFQPPKKRQIDIDTAMTSLAAKNGDDLVVMSKAEWDWENERPYTRKHFIAAYEGGSFVVVGKKNGWLQPGMNLKDPKTRARLSASRIAILPRAATEFKAVLRKLHIDPESVQLEDKRSFRDREELIDELVDANGVDVIAVEKSSFETYQEIKPARGARLVPIGLASLPPLTLIYNKDTVPQAVSQAMRERLIAASDPNSIMSTFLAGGAFGGVHSEGFVAPTH